MGNGQKGQARAYTYDTGMSVGMFRFDTAGASAPDGLEDPNGIVNGQGTYSATGQYIFTMTYRHQTVMAVVSSDEGTEHFTATVVDGLAAANTITLKAFDDADVHTAVASDNTKVTVWVGMSQN